MGHALALGAGLGVVLALALGVGVGKSGVIMRQALIDLIGAVVLPCSNVRLDLFQHGRIDTKQPSCCRQP